MILRNVSILQQHYTTSQPGDLDMKASNVEKRCLFRSSINGFLWYPNNGTKKQKVSGE